MGKNRRRIYALVSVVAVAGASLAVAPAFGADPAPDHVSFEANHALGPRFTYGSSTQGLSTEPRPSTCKLVSSGDELLALSAKSASGSELFVGMQNLGIGVRSTGSNANGSPCSQVDANELLTIEAGPDLLGRSFEKVELDLEMTGNAIVVLTLSSGSDATSFKLHTGTNFDVLCITTNPGSPGCTPQLNSAGVNIVDTEGQSDSGCLKPQNSGPSSNVNDNCIWTVEPGFEFDKITLTTTVGTVSLEGGSETGTHSKFYLADSVPVATNQTEYIDYTETGGEPDSHVFVLDASGISLTVDRLGYTDDDAWFRSGLTRAGGSVSIDPIDPLKVTYTPPKGFTGSDFFEYTVSDANGNEASATVTIYEVLDCGDTIEVDNGVISGSYTRLGTACTPKIYILDPVVSTSGTPVEGEPAIEIPTIRFIPSVPDVAPVDCSIISNRNGGACTDQYIGELTFRPLVAANPPSTGTLEYDPVPREDPKSAPADAFRAMQWCKADPLAGAILPAISDILPDPVGNEGESWCIISATTTTAGDGKTVTTWIVYGIGDPLKRVS